MTKVHSDKCPVCGSDSILPFLICNDFLVTKDNFNVCKCEKCGFALTEDFPSEDEIGRYYEAAEYISHSDTKEGLISKLYHIARKLALNSKGKIIEKYHNTKGKELLDIGTGTGYFLNHMKEQGWNVSGVEKSENARQYAHDKFGVDIYDSEYLYQFSDKSKDVITMWHVLEHLEHLDKVMSTVHRILTDDGTAIIALPNKNSYDAQFYKKDWAAYDVPRHLWHFSPDDFILLVKNHGFKTVAIKPMYFDAMYVSMLSEKNKASSLASFKGLILGSLFSARSVFDTKKCSSIMYIIKKI